MAHGSALPTVHSDLLKPLEKVPGGIEAHVRRGDDDWMMVMYNQGSDGGQQCGGTYEPVTGSSGSCNVIPGDKWCVDLKVNLGVCTFAFKSEGSSGACSGGEEAAVTIEAGKDSNGVSLSDKVKFVSVECKE